MAGSEESKKFFRLTSGSHFAIIHMERSGFSRHLITQDTGIL